jgi:hypothetical protein
MPGVAAVRASSRTAPSGSGPFKILQADRGPASAGPHRRAPAARLRAASCRRTSGPVSSLSAPFPIHFAAGSSDFASRRAVSTAARFSV